LATKILVGVIREPVVLGNNDFLLADHHFLGTHRHGHERQEQNSKNCQINQFLHFETPPKFEKHFFSEYTGWLNAVRVSLVKSTSFLC
jgi:hypothetical protein